MRKTKCKSTIPRLCFPRYLSQIRPSGGMLRSAWPEGNPSGPCGKMAKQGTGPSDASAEQDSLKRRTWPAAHRGPTPR